MSTSLTQLEADWVQTLDQAESDLTRIIGMFPDDRKLDYVRDLRSWARRVSDEAIARSFRVLNSLGYSKAVAATTLGISPNTLTRILRDQGVVENRPINPITFEVPEDALDISAQFDSYER
jgi:hypothetical protein